MWLKLIILTLGRLRQENYHESKCRLGCVISTRPGHGETLWGRGVEAISSQLSKNRTSVLKTNEPA